MPLNVSDCLRELILKEVFSIPDWSVLLLNRPTAVITSILFKKSHILKNKILTILRTENENYPEKMENFNSIYFVYLDKKTIKNIKKDIQKKKFKKYKIIFTGVEKTEKDKIAYVNATFENELNDGNLSIKHFDLHFTGLNDLVFSPISHENINQKEKKPEKSLETINLLLRQSAQSMINIYQMRPKIINLSDYEDFSNLSIQDSSEKKNDEYSLHGSSPIFLFLDRSIDRCCNLIHFFEFETCLTDLNILEIENQQIATFIDQSSQQKSSEKNNSKDFKKAPDGVTALKTSKLWKSLRHLHLAELNTFLTEEAHKLNMEMAVLGGSSKSEAASQNEGGVGNSSNEQQNKNNQPSIRTLRTAVLKAPSLIQKKQSLDTAITLCEKAIGQYPKLEDIALLEQDIINDPNNNYINRFFDILNGEKAVKRDNLLRIIKLLYLKGKRFSKSEMQQIKNQLLLTEQEIKNITLENIMKKEQMADQSTDFSEKSRLLIKKLQKYVLSRHSDWKYQTSRYTPLVIKLIDSLIIGQGPVHETFTSHSEEKSLRRSKFKKLKDQSIVLFIDRISIAEVNFLRRLSELRNYNIFICSLLIENQGDDIR